MDSAARVEEELKRSRELVERFPAEFELLGETDLASTTSNKTALLDHDLATAYYPRVKEILDLNPQLAHLCE